MRPGDILTHCFRPFPNNPATAEGGVRGAVLEARERGVIFDIGHGMGSFAFKTARTMLANGFAPDCISSDVHALCIDGPAFDLLTTMSKFLCLGMPLGDVVRAATEAPAQRFAAERSWGLPTRRGRRRVGPCARKRRLRLCGRDRRASRRPFAPFRARRCAERPMVGWLMISFKSERFRMSEPMTTSTPEQRLAALGLTLPAVPAPVANYVPYRWAGNLLFLSGQGPKLPDGSFQAGRLGRDASVEDGYRAARTVGLQLLAVAKSAVGEFVACRSGDQAARHGQRRAGLRRSPEGHQRLFRPSGRGAWRRRPPCSLGGWDGLPA